MGLILYFGLVVGVLWLLGLPGWMLSPSRSRWEAGAKATVGSLLFFVSVNALFSLLASPDLLPESGGHASSLAAGDALSLAPWVPIVSSALVPISGLGTVITWTPKQGK